MMEGGNAVDHVGVAVHSLAAARSFYEGLGMTMASEETMAGEGVKVMMLGTGVGRIELLEGLGEETAVGRFVARRGEGLHHLALRVRDVDAQFARLRSEGVRLASEAVKVGAGGHRYFFVHPESAGGVLLEMVEAAE